MTSFIQRLANATDDGLNPEDYPVETLIKLCDAISSDNL
jgi:hypothetical protein